MALRLLTVPEVAAQLRLSKSAVYAMAAEKRIPAVMLGGSGKPRIRIDANELNRWLYSEGSA